MIIEAVLWSLLLSPLLLLLTLKLFWSGSIKYRGRWPSKQYMTDRENAAADTEGSTLLAGSSRKQAGTHWTWRKCPHAG